MSDRYKKKYVTDTPCNYFYFILIKKNSNKIEIKEKLKYK